MISVSHSIFISCSTSLHNNLIAYFWVVPLSDFHLDIPSGIDTLTIYQLIKPASFGISYQQGLVLLVLLQVSQPSKSSAHINHPMFYVLYDKKTSTHFFDKSNSKMRNHAISTLSLCRPPGSAKGCLGRFQESATDALAPFVWMCHYA